LVNLPLATIRKLRIREKFLDNIEQYSVVLGQTSDKEYHRWRAVMRESLRGFLHTSDSYARAHEQGNSKETGKKRLRTTITQYVNKIEKLLTF
jgi:hypothetical protein